MNKIIMEAYKEGTDERMFRASSGQVRRLKEDGISFGDTMIFLNNFNFVRNFLVDEVYTNTKLLKIILQKEEKPLIIKGGTEDEVNNGDYIYSSTNYRWSAEDCNGGWFIVISKKS